MSHNISSFIGRQSAWHGLGQVTGEFMSWQSILAAGHLTYDVHKAQLASQDGTLVNAWGTFRSDNNAFLGVVGEHYQILSHKDGFEVMDALVGQINGAHYETAGSLGTGQVVWGLADLGQTIRVKGEDEHHQYLLMTASYDGSKAHSYGRTSVRVVCQNTLNMALSSKIASALRIRHTKSGSQKLIDAKAVLTQLNEENKSLEEKLNFLAERRVTKEAMISILDRLFPMSKKEKTEDGKEVLVSSTKRDNILTEILSLYESNDNNQFPTQRGTAYNLLNSITEYVDHSRSAQNGVQGRQLAATFGTGSQIKSEALEVILETAEGLPVVSQRTYYTPDPTPSESTSLLDSVLSMGVSNS